MALALKKDDRFTYGQFLEWCDEERWELIDGFAFNMSPAPNRFHQTILTNLISKFAVFLEGKVCRPFVAPFDVRLPLHGETEEEITNVVQPDLVIVCDRSKLDDRGCLGAPDLVVEILSPSTGKKDLNEKFQLYEKVGVKEYWVVYPGENAIVVYAWNDGKYDDGTVYTKEKCIQTSLFEEFSFQVEEAFRD